MRNLTLVLVVVSNLVVGIDNQVKIVNGIINPAEFISEQKKPTWVAYKVKAQQDTKSMCCWNNSDHESSQCDLDSVSHSYGTHGQSMVTEHVSVYVKVDEGKIERMLSVGDQCEVVLNKNKVNWLNDVTQDSSVQWLKKVIVKGQKPSSSDAMYSLALHQSAKASEVLYEMASKNNDIYSESAVFWLGELRADGVVYLRKLYERLPSGKVKRHINFALAQSGTDEGLEMLKIIAKQDSDDEQRADALFWLSQKNIDGVVSILLDAIKTDNSSSVRDKAVFGLSQVDTEQARDALLSLAQNHNDNEIQEKALFWLAHVSPKKAKDLVFDILKNEEKESKINQAVFALTQISESEREAGKENADEVLFQLLKGDYSGEVKKQALFWLSQSDNESTINKLQNLL